MKKKTSIIMLLFACFFLLAHIIIPHTHHDDHIHLINPFHSNLLEPGNSDNPHDDPDHCPFTGLSDCLLEDLALTSKSKRLASAPEAGLQFISDMAAIIPETNSGPQVHFSLVRKCCTTTEAPAIYTGRSVLSRAPPTS